MGRVLPIALGGRRLRIYLPAGAGPWPLALFLDGQNVFGDAGSFAGGWRLHEALDARERKGKRVPLVLALPNGGAARVEEYSPWSAMRGRPGNARSYLEHVVAPLIAEARRELPVLAAPADGLIAGSSLGGLFALYAFFERPDLFGAVLAMSPSLWVGRGAAFRHLAQARRGVPGRVYLDSGGREMGGAALRQAEDLARLLAERGYAPPRWLMWRPDKRGSHNERAWRRRLPKALRFLYPDR